MESSLSRNIVVTTPDMLGQVPVSSEFSVGAAATLTTNGRGRVHSFPGGETSAVKGLGVLTAMPFIVRGNSLVDSV